MLPAFIPVLVDGLLDFTTDTRGDVGSWVRESSVEALEVILTYIHQQKQYNELLPSLFTSGVSKQIVALNLRLCVDRIDRVRARAGRFILQLLDENTSSTRLLPTIPDYIQLQLIFPK